MLRLTVTRRNTFSGASKTSADLPLIHCLITNERKLEITLEEVVLASGSILTSVGQDPPA